MRMVKGIRLSDWILFTNLSDDLSVLFVDYCLYNGVRYYQGQTWNDGCEKACRCDDSSKGLYVCDSRCPSYPTPLPKECKLVTTPTDPCCQEPQCDIPSYLTNMTGTISPNMIPTLAPQGQITGHANTPAPTPGIGGNTPVPVPINYCEYKGSKYNQGQRWDDGCDYTCECVNAMNGYYTCKERCPKYGALPPQCTLQKDPANPCCRKPECSFNPSINQIVGMGTTKAPLPGQTYAPTPAPSNGPNVYPTPSLPKAVCVYRGKSYTQGQQWYDGCEYSCTCENAPEGVYRCSKRCPEYQALPNGCFMVQDPQDPLCCKIPKCDIPPKYSNYSGYVSLPTPKPGVISGGSVTKAPTPAPKPTPGPGLTYAPGLQPSPQPTSAPKRKYFLYFNKIEYSRTLSHWYLLLKVCVYKGTEYKQGQRWDDGCDYTCECVNQITGYYRCVEKCAKYPDLPPQCQLVADYLNPCCKKPYCNFQGVNVANSRRFNRIILTEKSRNFVLHEVWKYLLYDCFLQSFLNINLDILSAACVYNGVPFKQGETWEDGCDLKCICENEMTGFYRCSDRCAKYPQVPQGCVLTTDPRDSCCRVPVCQPVAQTTPAPKPGVTHAPQPGQTVAPNPNGTPAPNVQPTPYIPSVPAVIIGQGVTPTPLPGQTPNPNPVCVYKGVSYQQGAKWQDGCDYNCECIDANTGKYKCTERCQRFVNLPSNCRLEADLNDVCCKRSVCSPTPGPYPNLVNTPAPQPGVTNPPLNPTPGTGNTLKPNPLNTGTKSTTNTRTTTKDF
ncbi:LOW QUALITY PROTEIN: hypothetical protein KUTeg_019377 [Tegillarca granosa]|uniref:VWFC domain-containing protein n=1 Tax=Tegillarca granosa TaxID=220873 RepID=A0ABQ9EGJ8_TEGGR|nr:LOW QUALITY PROTEIN: hypothetical protein KUTeg_019377 [Tegillarca granosa]